MQAMKDIISFFKNNNKQKAQGQFSVDSQNKVIIIKIIIGQNV